MLYGSEAARQDYMQGGLPRAEFFERLASRDKRFMIVPDCGDYAHLEIPRRRIQNARWPISCSIASRRPGTGNVEHGTPTAHRTAAARAIGPIRLAPGVRPAQVGLFMLVVICAASVVTFLPLMQAYVFTEMLDVPKAGQGRLAGNLVTVQQLAVLLFIGFAGSLADRIGRRNVLAIAFAGYACCMFAYPLAGSVALLFVLQFLFGTLSTGHITGAATMIADYPDNASRGKFVAVNLLLQAALGALLVGWVGARLPGWLVAGGAAPDIAGRWAFWIVAAVALAAAVAVIGWLEDPPRAASPAPPPGGGLRGFTRNLGQVVAHGRRNPRFGLVMTMGFVIRADYFVMLSFVSLWVVNAAAERGISTVEALETAGLLTITLKIATAISQALFGFVADRVRRRPCWCCRWGPPAWRCARRRW